MPSSAPDRLAVRALLAVALCAFAALSVWRGADASWDLRNYHLYGAYAAWTGRLGQDVAPAQIQTFFSPAIDLLRMGVQAALAPRLALAVFAIPSAVAATLACRVALALAPGAGFWRIAASVVATVIGATGAAALPTAGSSMSDMPDGMFVLAAVALLVRAPGRPGTGALLGAGVCLGIAAGLRLPSAPLCLGVAAAQAVTGGLSRASVRGLTALLLAAAAAFLVVGGPWMAVLAWRHGSPTFPFYNDVFRSPELDPERIADRRFLPEGWAEAVFYPFEWAVRSKNHAAELPLRDPRLAFAWCGAVLGALFARTRQARFVVATCVFGYAAWAAEFGILRYLAPLEMLSGAALLTAMRRLSARQACVALAAILAVCVSVTRYPEWGHVVPRGAPVHVEAPPFEPDSLVVLLDGAAMAYLAVFSDPGARFVGANSNIVRPGQQTGLALEVEAALRDHAGPLWGLETTDQTGVADATLAYHRLTRQPGCLPVTTNLGPNPVIACRLARAPADPGR